MPIIDERTETLDLLLPHVDNDMQDDVERLRAALAGVDTFAASVILSLAGKAAMEHNHPLSQVNGLVTALNDLSDEIAQRSTLGHTHTLAAITDVNVTGATAGQFFKKVGLFWVPASIVISDVGNLPTVLGNKADLDGNAIIVPSGPSSGRPPSPAGKLIRFNESTSLFEVFNGTGWAALDIAAALLKANNLSDLQNATAARGNLSINAANTPFTPAGNIAATNVQAALVEFDSKKQASDATLTALAGVTTAADKLIYATGPDAFATTTLSSFGRSLIDDPDAANARVTLAAPALPQNASGTGQWAQIAPGGSSYTLPAGGTWAWWAFGFNSNGGAYQASGGINAGGSPILPNAVAGGYWAGIAWRIS